MDHARDELQRRLLGPRVSLRHWAVADAAELSALVQRNLDHLRPWMPWAAHEPIGDEARVALIEQWERDARAGGDVVFGVFLGDRAIGGCGLHRRRGPSGLEIGYWIAADHCGQGFATEVARILTSAAFTVPGVVFVEIHHDKANSASRRIPELLGYELVSETADDVEAPGDVGIDCAWRMEAESWSDR